MSSKHTYGMTVEWDGYVIGEVTAVGDVAITAKTWDKSTYTDKYDKHGLGTLSVGAIPVSGWYDPADTNGQIKFMTDLRARAEDKYLSVVHPDHGIVWRVPALPIGFTTTHPMGNGMGFALNVQPTGEPEFMPTASNNLSGLTISNSAVIAPAFAAGTYKYIATVLTGVTSVTITPTASAGVITVNGNAVTSGVASSAIALGAAGTITTVTVVVKETGKSAKTYTVDIVRAAS